MDTLRTFVNPRFVFMNLGRPLLYEPVRMRRRRNRGQIVRMRGIDVTETTPPKVAVVGLGVYGQLHARTYAAAQDAELVAVCDIRPERAQATATELGCHAFTD